MRLLQEDVASSRNLREKLAAAIVVLEGDGDFSSRKSRVLSVLGELSEDPNMPSIARTQLYSVMSLLESV